MIKHLKTIKLAAFVLTTVLLSLPLSCTRRLTECEGPALNLGQISQIQKSLFSSGPRGFLVVPNPIDATRNPTVMADDASLDNLIDDINLFGLLSPSRLENDLVKVRLRTIEDSAGVLASPNSNGDYNYEVTDPHYSEVMAYYGVNSILRYVGALGFTFSRSRPIYVMARAQQDSGGNVINALYEHNLLNPTQPRTMRLYGDTPFAPGMDRDMYWHETGHFMVESISREVGVDLAGDSGASYTEAGGLHECLADYVAESLGNKPFIGKWINRNFQGTAPGQPLRWAVDAERSHDTFSKVITHDGTDKNLDRYRTAEWCTRLLWDLRNQFAKEDPKTGTIFADRVVLTAVSMLKQDTSIAQFKTALETADQKLHCGLHKRSIDKTFEARGFQDDPEKLGRPLQISAQPVTSTQYAGEFTFNVRITNPNGVTARNVRLVLESRDGGFHPTTYMQGFGDLPPGRSIVIGDTGTGLSQNYSVWGALDTGRAGVRVRYRVIARSENGADGVAQGEFTQ